MLLVGGGLGVAPNGLNVLKRLDEELLKGRTLCVGGYVTAISNMKNKNGWPLCSMKSASLDDKSGHDNSRSPYMLATSRHSLWTALRGRSPDHHIIHKRISQVVARSNGRNLINLPMTALQWRRIWLSAQTVSGVLLSEHFSRMLKRIHIPRTMSK